MINVWCHWCFYYLVRFRARDKDCSDAIQCQWLIYSFVDSPFHSLIHLFFILLFESLIYYGAVLRRRRPHHVSILSVRLSVPCRHLEGKRKGLRIPNLVRRVHGTPAPRGPISRSRGQRSRSRRLIAFLPLTSQCLLVTVYIESLTKP